MEMKTVPPSPADSQKRMAPKSDAAPRRQVAVSALAVVGFVVLILIGIALAIYAARYVPVALNRLGIAAVSMSSVFTSDEDEPQLEVTIPGDSLPFEPIATSTDDGATETGADSPEAPATPASGGTGSTGGTATTGTTAGTPTTVSVPVYVPPAPPYGKADLVVDITATGYCSNDRTSSFRAAREVPDDENGGFRFVVRNAGTNVSGQWDLAYELPTSPTLERTASNQRSLKPNDRIEYTVCFTEPRSGSNRDITVEVDADDDVDESNERNNTDTAEIDIDS